MTIQRGKERLRTKEKKMLQSLRPSHWFGSRSLGGWGKAMRRGGVCISCLQFSVQSFIERRGLWPTCLGTHLYGTEGRRQLGGEKLPSSLLCEPLGNRKEITIWPPSLPAKSKPYQKPGEGGELKWCLALFWASRAQGLSATFALNITVLLFWHIWATPFSYFPRVSGWLMLGPLPHLNTEITQGHSRGKRGSKEIPEINTKQN